LSSLFAFCELQACLRSEKWRAFEMLTSHMSGALSYLGEVRDDLVSATEVSFNKRFTNMAVRITLLALALRYGSGSLLISAQVVFCVLGELGRIARG
jgi:hypothetical protein